MAESTLDPYFRRMAAERARNAAAEAADYEARAAELRAQVRLLTYTWQLEAEDITGEMA